MFKLGTVDKGSEPFKIPMSRVPQDRGSIEIPSSSEEEEEAETDEAGVKLCKRTASTFQKCFFNSQAL